MTKMDTRESYDQNITEMMYHLLELINAIHENGEIALFSRLFQTDFRIINYLHSHPDSHPSELADKLKVTRPQVAANLRILEENGLIERTMDSKNRRQIFVKNTPLAEEKLKICYERLSKLFLSWFDILGQEEVGHLIKILEISADPSIVPENLKDFDFGL